VSQCTNPPHWLNHRRTAICDWVLRPTPSNNLPVLAGIQPAEFFRKAATQPLACSALEPGHLLHFALTSTPDEKQEQLKSSHSFVSAAQELLHRQQCCTLGGLHVEDGVGKSNTSLREFIPDVSTNPAGMSLQR